MTTVTKDTESFCSPAAAPMAEPTPLDLLPPETRAQLESHADARAATVRLQAGSFQLPQTDRQAPADAELPAEDGARVRRVKRDLLRIEAAVPPEAVVEGFDRCIKYRYAMWELGCIGARASRHIGKYHQGFRQVCVRVSGACDTCRVSGEGPAGSCTPLQELASSTAAPAAANQD